MGIIGLIRNYKNRHRLIKEAKHASRTVTNQKIREYWVAHPNLNLSEFIEEDSDATSPDEEPCEKIPGIVDGAHQWRPGPMEDNIPFD